MTESDGYECGTYAAKFDVTMKVTESGIAHWEDIVHAVFEYLTMLRASKYPDWVFDELRAISDISFRFMEETSAVENCEELAEIMQVSSQGQRCSVSNKLRSDHLQLL